ncbi:hypothetical protein [Methanolapillus ohkumae]|uniref:Uncharacterized protein n=1 Tax=Methanolapillus ohkumae TaxID=3028298 RepID=A0AA96V8Y8_9EURY|nr:hypothetical protein MsAm2_16390 [Methanosarcinaceae archaeon Am2]
MKVIIFFLLIDLIFVFYFASRKNFIIIPNRRFDSILSRALFLFPSFSFIWLLSLIFVFHYDDLFSYPITIQLILKYPVLLSPIAIELFVILFFKKFILRSDFPFEFQPNFMSYDLYVFTPVISIIDARIFTSLKEVESLYDSHKEITISKSDVKGVSLAYTKRGEIIISEEVLEIFNKNNLTGFQALPVQYSDQNHQNKKSKTDLNIQYFQIITTRAMPPFSKKSTKKVGYSAERIVYDGDICYEKKVLLESFDFNRSFETIGPKDMIGYFPQSYWILSRRVVEILINELNQPKKDFKPVILVDEE